MFQFAEVAMGLDKLEATKTKRNARPATGVERAAGVPKGATMLGGLPVAMAGPLRKQRALSGWTRVKHFEIRGQVLLGYKTESEDKVAGAAPRAPVTLRIPLANASVSSRRARQGVIIRVAPAPRQTSVAGALRKVTPVELLAESAEAAMPWLSALRQASRPAPRSGAFQSVANLGTGAYGRVRLVRRRDSGRFFALKEVPLAGVAGPSAFARDDGCDADHVAAGEPAAVVPAAAGAGDETPPATSEGAGAVAVKEETDEEIEASLRGSRLRHAITERTSLHRAAATKGPGHQFIAQLQWAWLENGRLHYVQTLGDGGDLHTNLLAQPSTRFSELAARHIIAELVLAVGHLHACDVVHRDIKLENVLLDRDGHVLLTDFGLAKALRARDDRSFSYCGTERYMPPEMVLGHAHGRGVDWWQVGCVAFELLTGRSPFHSRNPKRLSEAILAAKPRWPAAVAVSEQAKAFVGALLTRNTWERLGNSDTDVAEVRAHAWFAGDAEAAPEAVGAASTIDTVPGEGATLPQLLPLDWAAVERRAAPAPYAPGVRHVPAAATEHVRQTMSMSASMSGSALSLLAATAPAGGAGVAGSSCATGSVGSNLSGSGAVVSEEDDDFLGFDYACPLEDEVDSGLTGSEWLVEAEAEADADAEAEAEAEADAEGAAAATAAATGDGETAVTAVEGETETGAEAAGVAAVAAEAASVLAAVSVSSELSGEVPVAAGTASAEAEAACRGAAGKTSGERAHEADAMSDSEEEPPAGPVAAPTRSGGVRSAAGAGVASALSGSPPPSMRGIKPSMPPPLPPALTLTRSTSSSVAASAAAAASAMAASLVTAAVGLSEGLRAGPGKLLRDVSGTFSGTGGRACSRDEEAPSDALFGSLVSRSPRGEDGLVFAGSKRLAAIPAHGTPAVWDATPPGSSNDLLADDDGSYDERCDDGGDGAGPLSLAIVTPVA